MFKKKQSTPTQKVKVDHEQLGQMLVNIYETGYIDRNQMYKMSFIKGLVSGLGGVLGATILVAVLIWILSFFQRVPGLDRVYDNFRNNVQTQPK